MNDTPQPRLTRSVEDYLKAVYALTEREESASTSALAESLDVQPASVTGMVKRLAECGYLEHARYHGVRLTEAGSREALRIIRRHRILETYLYMHLGYSWEDVHQEAERLEHAASDALIDRMAAILKHPSHDPHGAPIPTPSGEIEVLQFVTLNEVAPGVAVQIRAVQDEDPDRLRYLETLGPGAGSSDHRSGESPLRRTHDGIRWDSRGRGGHRFRPRRRDLRDSSTRPLTVR